MADIPDTSQTNQPTPSQPTDQPVPVSPLVSDQIPPEPEPEPVVPPATDLPTPPSPTGDLTQTEMPPAATSDSLIIQPPGETTPSEKTSKEMPAATDVLKKKRVKPAVLIAILLFFLLTLPLTVFFVSQQRELADIRSLAGPNNSFSQGGRWNTNEGCRGSGCVEGPVVGPGGTYLPDGGSGGSGQTTPKPVTTLSTPQYADCLRNSRGIPSLVSGCNESSGSNVQPGNLVVGERVDANTEGTCDSQGGSFIDGKCYKDYSLDTYIAGINAYLTGPINPNVGKICNRGAVGSNAYGDAVSSCGEGAGCINNICVAGNTCNGDSDCTGGAICKGQISIEGPRGGFTTPTSGVCLAPNATVTPATCGNTICPSGTHSECIGVSPICISDVSPGTPICMRYLSCPSGWECTGDAVPGTPGTSFASKYCVPTGGGSQPPSTSGGGGDPDNPTNPPPQCISLIAYKDGNALTTAELADLDVGDVITLAFAPGGASTKVRFRVNSTNDADWHETTTKNANSQFVWDYTLANTTSFNIEAQWFDGSSWH